MFIYGNRSKYGLCQMCEVLDVTRQGYNKWLKSQGKPYKHEALLALITERGALIVNGVVIGILGNRHDNFKTDLPRIIADIDRLIAEGKSLCVLGDFNCTFVNYMFFRNIISRIKSVISSS